MLYGFVGAIAVCLYDCRLCECFTYLLILLRCCVCTLDAAAAAVLQSSQSMLHFLCSCRRDSINYTIDKLLFACSQIMSYTP